MNNPVPRTVQTDAKTIPANDAAMPLCSDSLRNFIGKRVLDISIALPLLLVASPLLIAIAITVRLTSRGPAIYWSKRVGKGNQIFLMPKFRSMRIDAPQVATHLLSRPEEYLTRIGRFLRRTSLDELPQLYSILRGDLSFVGPRPALFNQYDLVALRTEVGIHRLIPGLTGWAQVNGRDELSIEQKVQLDFEYFQRQSMLFDIQILFLTLAKVISSEGVSH
jgi:O-antigen biosynthesis protein WbqP